MKRSLKKRSLIKQSAGDKALTVFIYGFLGICMLVTIFPLWNVVMTSLVEVGEFNTRAIILWPKKFSFASYKYLLSSKAGITRAMGVTALLTLAGTLYSLSITTAVSYAMSKKSLPGRGFLLVFFLIPMYFGGGLIPYYLLIKNLGLMDKFIVMFVPNAVNIYYFLVIKSFFSEIPNDIEESARIDGANDIGIFLKIILPISTPMLATFALFYAVGYWSTWWSCMLFIQKPQLYTLQLVLRKMVAISDESSFSSALTQQARESGLYLFEDGLRMATVTIATLPILLLYPFLQKYFVKGVMIGSVKG